MPSRFLARPLPPPWTKLKFIHLKKNFKSFSPVTPNTVRESGGKGMKKCLSVNNRPKRFDQDCWLCKVALLEKRIVQLTFVVLIAGLPRARSARGTEPHTHRIWSTSFLLVQLWGSCFFLQQKEDTSTNSEELATPENLIRSSQWFIIHCFVENNDEQAVERNPCFARAAYRLVSYLKAVGWGRLQWQSREKWSTRFRDPKLFSFIFCRWRGFSTLTLKSLLFVFKFFFLAP